VLPETQVEDNFKSDAVATNENQTSSSVEPELVVHAPAGVTGEFVAPCVLWLLRDAQEPSEGITGKAVAPAQLSLTGGGGMVPH
jgi:hypothetical protein